MKAKSNYFFVMLALMPLLTFRPATAQTLTTLHTFTGSATIINSDGANSKAGLILSGTIFYGTASGGGSAGSGTVFKVNMNGLGYTVLHTFTAMNFNTNSDGASPQAGLILSGNTLYGTAYSGGSSGNGTVFKVNTDGTGFTTLHSFTTTSIDDDNFPDTEYTNSDGANPAASLILSGSILYGTASVGGSSGNGTVFAVNTNGIGFTNLYSFSSTDPYAITNSDGANPQASLILSGNTLYGTAYNGGGGMIGGASGEGTVFKVNTDGTSFKTLYSFTDDDDGANPAASLILSGSTLYGTTYSGGGTIFKVNTDGSSFTTLFTFTGGFEGGGPSAGLILSGSTLYGTASYGGTADNGTVFSINTSGKNFKGFSLTGNDGINPVCSLILSGSTLYGTTSAGGINGSGTIFKVNTDGSSFANLYSFTMGQVDGSVPSSLALSGTTLYATTEDGGNNGTGTIFKVNTDGTGFTNFYNFATGVFSPSALISSGSTLYGTTFFGGSFGGDGTVFCIQTNGAGFTNLYNFTGGSDGAYPAASLILSGNTLYGTAYNGGNSGSGTVFKVNTDGSGFKTIYAFTAEGLDAVNILTNSGDGANPNAGLVLSGNTLYGVTYDCGISENDGYSDISAGTVFKVNTDGTGFTNLYRFTGGGDGANPAASLILSGNTLYGTTFFGGSPTNGTVFKVNTDGTKFATLYSFTDGDDGANPDASLILSGNTLYGTAYNGGASGEGTVFKVNTDGTSFATLYSFTDGDDGANTATSLILSGSTLYGTASGGGGSDSGTVFSLSLGSVSTSPPVIFGISLSGANLVLNGINGVSGTTNYLLMGTNLMEPMSQWTPIATNILGASGNFTITATNAVSHAASQRFYRVLLVQ